jgi:hypothetical protein
MPHTPRTNTTTGDTRPLGQPRGRPRKNIATPVRFASIRLDHATNTQNNTTPSGHPLELLFTDGLLLRATRDADPETIARLARHLRQRGE